MNIDRVYVVTILENSEAVTRMPTTRDTGLELLAWICSKGKTASIRLMDEFPVRTKAELLRAAEYLVQFVQETDNGGEIEKEHHRG